MIWTASAAIVDINGDALPDIFDANYVVGNDVYNQESQDLGDIKEIMLDMRSGRVCYAVLSFGGFLGMGKKTRIY